MYFLYSTAIRLYALAILVASLFNSKASKFIKGRKNLFAELEKRFTSKTRKRIWFHCASLGEFEQGRPLLERVKKEKPDWEIILTFFSPSGYEVRKNYPLADHICYLPLDTRANAKKFADIVQPDIAVFVKYEFWFNFLSVLKERKTQTYLISAIFRNDQLFFRWYGRWFRKKLDVYDHIFTQDDDSAELIRKSGISSVSLAGDTRFDRVSEIAGSAKAIPLAQAFSKDRFTIVCGSTWEADEDVLAKALDTIRIHRPVNEPLCLIVAPHEIDEPHLQSLEKKFSEWNPVRYSHLKEENTLTHSMLIIDNIGMLSSLYRYGQIAYIGGGFGTGIHNTLEAAVYGIPVIFGPHYSKFMEAAELVKAGGGFPVYSSKHLTEIFIFLMKDTTVYQMASMVSKDFVRTRRGATEIIYRKLF